MKEHRLSNLITQLDYSFGDVELLEVALTHSSYANENKSSGLVSNERLEFFGDAILEMVVSKLLYENAENLPEGRMTKIRSELVCEKSLASVAGDLNLGSYIKLGKGEEKGGGRNRSSILADAVEAVIAAIYLDGGIEPVIKLIKKVLVKDIGQLLQENTDYKTALQELVQVKSDQSISYSVKGESGPDHMKVFAVEVQLNGVPVGHGEGRSKKIAEQMAAKAALMKLRDE